MNHILFISMKGVFSLVNTYIYIRFIIIVVSFLILEKKQSHLFVYKISLNINRNFILLEGKKEKNFKNATLFLILKFIYFFFIFN